jgi:mono/diheme cytochrome c family protein
LTQRRDGKENPVRMFARGITLALLALALGVGVAACGGDDDEAGGTTTEQTTTEETTTDETTTAGGEEVFTANCGSCHTLSAAGTTGSIGPSLDGAGLDAAAVEQQVRNGGGGMPAFQDQLSEEEIAAVSTYVAESSG